MKAAVLTSPQDVSKRPLRIVEVSKPELKPGHVLLRVLACGVCRTDLHIIEGELPFLREKLVPGHQIVGEVVDGATDQLPVGTRVGVSWIGGTDGKCWYCQRGLENLCDSPTFTVSTRGASHRNLAASLGATWVGNEKDRPPVALDRAVTFAPSGDMVVAALASLRKGGVVAINAIHLDRIPEFDYDRLLWGERQLRSVSNMTRSDARDFLQIASEIGLRPKVTSFSLEQANEALIAVKNDSIDGATAIVPNGSSGHTAESHGSR